MSHFRLQLGSLEGYDGSGDFGDWLRRLLSYLSMSNQRYNIIAQRDLKYAPEAHTRDNMAQLYDADLLVEDSMQGADYLASVLFDS